jgi:hypothetical protein
MGSIRWYFVLRAKRFRLPPLRVFRIFFIGQFFNAFFLGACGGDLARAFYAAQEEPGRKAEAASTVLVDRVIGLITFIVFGCLMIAFNLPVFTARRTTRLAAILMLLFLVCGFILLALFFRRNLFESIPLFQRLAANSALGALLRKVYEVLFFYRAHVRIMCIAVCFSFFNLFFLTMAAFFFGCSLDIRIGVMPYFLFFPIITVFTAVPVTPGALGIREGLFAAMFSAAGIAHFRSIPLSLLVYLGGVACSLLGGILFLFHTSASARQIREDLQQIREEKEVFP